MLNQLIRSVADDSTNAMFDKYVAAAGDTDLNKFLDAAVKVSEFESYIKNHKELQAEYVKVLNRIAPEHWGFLKDECMDVWYKEHAEFDSKDVGKIETLLQNLQTDQVNDKYMFDIMSSLAKPETEKSLTFKRLKNMSDDDFDKFEYKKRLSLKGITLYHGAPSIYYRSIVNDGLLKSTDYSDISLKEVYDNQKLESMIHNETGYVFACTSMDYPLYRSIYENLSNTIDGRKKIGYGVIFEINPSNYDVFLYKMDEFLIKGNVDLKDTTPHFFKLNNNGLIVESTYEEFEKEGAFDDLRNE